MRFLQVLSAAAVLTFYFAVGSLTPNKNAIDLSLLSGSITQIAQNPQCGDCIAYLDKCLNACGPMNPKCVEKCQTVTCTSGPEHCRTGEECAFPVPVCQASGGDVPQCGDCIAYLDHCLNTCGPRNSSCVTHCQEETCTKGPDHCHRGEECALPVPVCQVPDSNELGARQENSCKRCDDELESCWSNCEPVWDWPCRYACEQSLCYTGAPECRFGGACGKSCPSTSTLVPLPPTPGVCSSCDQLEYKCLRDTCKDLGPGCIHSCHVAKCQSPDCRDKQECGCGASKVRQTSAPSSSLSASTLVSSTRLVPTPLPTGSPGDSCEPCVQYFKDCMDNCPLPDCIGYINVCLFRTCGAVGKECPSNCLVGVGASLGDCPNN